MPLRTANETIARSTTIVEANFDPKFLGAVAAIMNGQSEGLIAPMQAFALLQRFLIAHDLPSGDKTHASLNRLLTSQQYESYAKHVWKKNEIQGKL